MLTLPLYVFLIIYFVFLFFFGLFFLINIAHLYQTAALTVASFIVTLIMLAAIAIIIWATWYLLQNTDWTQTVTLFDSSWFSGLLSFNQTI
ncbi:MAG: hypothetical protein PHD72_03790 [Patescibacteria group bacterium]|nr:hypothetical protein [Patescibacteria group bacterium]